MKKKNQNPDLESAIDKLEKSSAFSEPSEMGEVFSNLDSDRIDPSTRMSSVDFNSRLNEMEINSILVIDELMRLGIFPDESGITRQKKRLSISKDGEGRKEKVAIIAGNREFQSGGGAMECLGNMFKRRE